VKITTFIRETVSFHY